MEKKNNIIQRIRHAFYDFSYYKTFLNETVGKALWMIVLVTFIFSFISSGLAIAFFGNDIEETMTIAVNEMPYFKLADGKLSSNDDSFKVFGANGDYVVFDIEGAIDDIEFLKKYSSGVYITSDHAMVASQGEIRRIQFSDLQGIHFDRNDLQNMIGPFMIVIKAVMMIMPFIQVIGKIINLLLVALLCIVIGLGFKRRSSFSEAYKIACYANVVPTVVLGLLGMIPAVNLMLGWSYSVVYYGGTLIYAAMIYQRMQKELPDTDQTIDEFED